jgi:predicted PurR-regulated permease PerM
MESLTMQNKLSNKYFFIIVGLIVVALLYLLAPILTPFLAGSLLAYLAAPVVAKLEKFLPHLLSVILVFLGVFLVILLFFLLLIPLIEKQILLIPSIVNWLQDVAFPWVITKLHLQDEISLDVIKKTVLQNLSKASGAAEVVFRTAVDSGLKLVIWIMNIVLVPVVTFYLLRDWDYILKNIRNLLPRSVEPTFMKLANQSDEVLSAFIRGQLLVMLALGVIYSLGLTIIGLKIGIIIGLIAGLVSIVPYLGFIVGIISASIAAYVQFGAFFNVILVWIVFAIGQALEGSVLTPNLVGNRIGLHPVAVIFAVLTGGSLFGFFGVLLALPTAAVIMVLLRYINSRYRHSQLYQ